MKVLEDITTILTLQTVDEMDPSLAIHAADGDVANQDLSRHESCAPRHPKQSDAMQNTPEALELRVSRTSRREDVEPGLTDVPEEEMTNVANIEPVPPNGGYGWVCVLAVFLINAHTWGVNAVGFFLFSGHANHDAF